MAFDECIHKKLWTCLSRDGVQRTFLFTFDNLNLVLK